MQLVGLSTTSTHNPHALPSLNFIITTCLNVCGSKGKIFGRTW